MQVHSVLFTDTPHGANYERMAQVLSHTIAANSPNTPLALHRVTEPDEDLIAAMNQRPNKGTRKQLYLDNARKTKHHCRIVRDAMDGEVICLMDSDVMVLGDLSDVEMGGADMIVTYRPEGCRFPFNSGVLFVLVNDATRFFFQEWLHIVFKMLANWKLHEDWKAEKNGRCGYGGLNQAAFGYLIDEFSPAITSIMPLISELPCIIWNCENDCLRRELFSDETKVVHVNGNLRRVLFHGEHPQNKTIVKVADFWRRFEREAKGVAS